MVTATIIATDPLSLVFIGCFLFGTFFVLLSALLGGLGHGLGHHGGSALHLGGHTHAPAPAHAPHAAGHAAGSSAHAPGQATSTSAHSNPASHGQGQVSQQGPLSLLSHLLSYINPWSVVFFLLGFGFFGYLFYNATHLDVLFSLLLATLTGLILTGLVLALLFRLFGDSESETIQDVSDRTGLIGKVSLPIRENAVGEVIYVSPGGLRKSVPARSLDGRPIERGQEVIILSYQRGIAEVETWEHFFEQEASKHQVRTPTGAELEQLRALLQDQDQMMQNQ
jgi:hypothetical protein